MDIFNVLKVNAIDLMALCALHGVVSRLAAGHEYTQ